MTLAICHVTKRGEIAGPKALEHAVDCSILIRKAYNRRMVSVLKNRFGPETARPMQLEIDPITLKLRMSPHTETLTAVARGYLPGAGLTEVQGAVALPKPGAAAKVTAPGLPRKEIEQYVSGLCQVPGFELADFDLSIQCRVPGERRYPVMSSVRFIRLQRRSKDMTLNKLAVTIPLFLAKWVPNATSAMPSLLQELFEVTGKLWASRGPSHPRRPFPIRRVLNELLL
jgi:hypothetical protein